MDERDILDCIRHLIAEQHRMRVAQAGRAWSAEALGRLHEVQRSLDDLWVDLGRLRADPACLTRQAGGRTSRVIEFAW